MTERHLQIIVHWIPGTAPQPIMLGEWDDSVREAVDKLFDENPKKRILK
jgi:hypothetical protein